jgi:2,4'-dihydroxyacetophenone dioxygenase
VLTLIVPEEVSEMITFFNISGVMIYLDENRNQVYYEDVFTKIEMCRKHYTEVGLGAEYIEQFIR